MYASDDAVIVFPTPPFCVITAIIFMMCVLLLSLSIFFASVLRVHSSRYTLRTPASTYLCVLCLRRTICTHRRRSKVLLLLRYSCLSFPRCSHNGCRGIFRTEKRNHFASCCSVSRVFVFPAPRPAFQFINRSLVASNVIVLFDFDDLLPIRTFSLINLDESGPVHGESAVNTQVVSSPDRSVHLIELSDYCCIFIHAPVLTFSSVARYRTAT